MGVFDGLDDLVELFVFRLFHLAEFTEPSLFKLDLIGVVLLHSLPLELMLELKLIKFLYLFLLHSIDLLNFLVVFDFFDPLSFRNFVVEFIDKSIIQLLSFFVGLLLLLLLLCI